MIQQALQSRKENDPPVFLVPTYDIDLIWHTHQLHPSAYARDTTSLIGRILDHDDTDTDRGAGKKLNNGYLDSCNRWWATFGFVYERAGAMHRGPDPPMRGAPAKSTTTDGWAMTRDRTILENTKYGRWNSSYYDSLMKSAAEQTPAENARSTCQVGVQALATDIETFHFINCIQNWSRIDAWIRTVKVSYNSKVRKVVCSRMDPITDYCYNCLPNRQPFRLNWALVTKTVGCTHSLLTSCLARRALQ